MGGDRNYLAVELATDGEREAVMDAVEREGRIRYETTTDGMLIFVGPNQYQPCLDRLQTVVSHLRRGVLVHHADTASVTNGYYLVAEDGAFVIYDELVDGRDESLVFDHFAREYEIHVPF